VILSLQLARFLVKAVEDTREGKAVAESVKYIEEGGEPVQVHSFDAAAILGMLGDRSRRFAIRLHDKLHAALAKGVQYDTALNSVAMVAYKAAEAHSAYVLMQNSFLALDTFEAPDSTKAVLSRLIELQGVMHIAEHAGDWLGSLTEADLDLAQDRIVELLTVLRPEAVGLSDAFGFTDDALKSTIGKYDGNVYEAIYDAAARNPVNQSPVMVGWEDLSKQLDLSFLKEGELSQHSIPTASSKL
jgi:hypothetical protein